MHEPKGVSTAADGQIYIADGAGSGAWKHDITNTHGDMIVTGNTTATATTAATDASLATDSDYVKITAGWALAHAKRITFNVDELVIPTAGEYLIHFWCDIKTPLNNNFVGVKYAVNDTPPYSNRKIISQSTSANDYLNVSASGIVTSLVLNDTISVYVASTKTDNLIIQEAGLVALLLHS